MAAELQAILDDMAGDGGMTATVMTPAGGPAAAIASDSPSLANWWRAFCAGEIVSQASLSEMSTLVERPSIGEWAPTGGYGLGLYNVADPYAHAVGHTGVDIGFMAWAACLPEDGAVVVVLMNHHVDLGTFARPLVDALDSD